MPAQPLPLSSATATVTTTLTTTRTAMPAGRVVLLIALLIGLQPLSTDLYLPALPALTNGFGASMTQAQLTLTALVLALGVSQLFWGPVSDRFGRRPVLLVGLVAYALASIACALATSMDLLIFWRAVQGTAMGAGVVCGRAIVRDLYEPTEGARVMSKAMSGLAVIACASPPLGGLLSDLFGWRVALTTLAVFGLVTLALLLWGYEETIPQKNPQALAPGKLLANWLMVLRHPTFRAFSALTTVSYAGLFTILAASSFVYIQVLGWSKTGYGLAMLANSLAYMAGTFLCRRLITRFGVPHSVALAGGVSLIAGTLMGTLALAGVQSGWALLLPQCLFMIGHGVHQPCGQSGAVGPFPQAAGAASAVNGFLVMLMAFAVGSWLGTHMDGSVLPLALGVWFWSAVTALVAWTLVRRHGQSGKR
jgi:DHA1 family bicyclomycin/chloramphenicol resistance-like MFS transporter